jgi:16S rRNA (guanine527-N7)-methyltransferase
MFIDEMKQAASDYGISLSNQQLQQFNRYYELLVEWNEKMNLTAITEAHEVAVKHMIDSLTAYDEKLFQGSVSVIDVGTGQAFPACHSRFSVRRSV